MLIYLLLVYRPLINKRQSNAFWIICSQNTSLGDIKTLNLHSVPTWLIISEALLTRCISGVSAPTCIPFPLISVSKSFLYTFCKKGCYNLQLYCTLKPMVIGVCHLQRHPCKTGLQQQLRQGNLLLSQVILITINLLEEYFHIFLKGSLCFSSNVVYKHYSVHTWLAISEAFLARCISGVSMPTCIPFPLISVSRSFLYSFCEE